MFKEFTVEGKNKEQVLKDLLINMNCEEENIYYYEEKINSRFFGTKKIKLIGIYRENIKNSLLNFFDIFSSLINIKIDVEILTNNDIISVALNSENNSVLIGSGGKTINSLQLYLNNVFSNLKKYNVKINIDIAKYKENKINEFEKEIKKIIDEVLNTKIDVKLDPMNSYKRRIVHTIVSNHQNLKTESIGDEPNRYIVIKYKD